MTQQVDHPTYYQGEKECIEVMREMFGDQAVIDFCKCNAFKYKFRAGHKEGSSEDEDLAKAKWYEDYMTNLLGLKE